MLSGGGDGRVTVWNLKSRRVEQSIQAHSCQSVLNLLNVSQLQFLSQGRDGFIRIWDINQLKCDYEFNTHCYTFAKCAIGHDSTNLVLAPNKDPGVVGWV